MHQAGSWEREVNFFLKLEEAQLPHAPRFYAILDVSSLNC